ncbi:MAG: carbohydrate ABC transporter permease [Bacilli bacterium]|nr:carbohydrate ABC transporter permease [Bacilli bacterium]
MNKRKKKVIGTTLVLVSPYKEVDPLKQAKKEKRRTIIRLILIYAFLSIAGLVCVFPFYYMVAASGMTQDEITSGKMVPDLLSFFDNLATNYYETFTRLNYMSHVGSTLLIAFTITIFQVLTTILAAFAFARLEFKGRDVLFIAFLATMMVPGELLAITNYTTLSNMGLTGLNQNAFQAFLAVVLPLIASTFYIYLLRQNFKQIPNELYLAAKMDGTSDWKYLWKVMVPIAMPTLITITILSIIGQWNNYVWPSLVVYNDDYTMISVIIRKGYLSLQGQDGAPVLQYAWQMASAVLTVVPLLILFIIFRKYIMKGTSRAGIKG